MTHDFSKVESITNNKELNQRSVSKNKIIVRIPCINIFVSITIQAKEIDSQKDRKEQSKREELNISEEF